MDAGLELQGYTSQGQFLLNCGILDLLSDIPNNSLDYIRAASAVNKLLMPHEMGELFKVIGFCTGEPWDAIGFSAGDRTHTL